MRDINGKASKRETAVERNRAPIANLGRDLRRQYEDGAADDLVDADRGEVPPAEFAPKRDGWSRVGGWRSRYARHAECSFITADAFRCGDGHESAQVGPLVNLLGCGVGPSVRSSAAQCAIEKLAQLSKPGSQSIFLPATAISRCGRLSAK